MTDIPSRYFDINPSWFWDNYTDLLNLFKNVFPLPNQASCAVFSRSSAAIMKVISVMQMKNFEVGEWLQLKNSGKNVGNICVTSSDLWGWSLGYKMSRTSR